MITTIDPSLEAGDTIIAALKADETLNDIVPAAQVYPPRIPATVTFPYIRVGVMSSTPLRLDVAPGGDVSGVVHCFTKIAGDVPDPRALAHQINAHIVRILDAIDSNVDDQIEDQAISIQTTQSQVFDDPAEADVYHGIVSYVATVT